MKILVLNGSPKIRRGNTFKITEAFLEGFERDSKNEVEIVDIYKKKIFDCTGCFHCWTKTPGVCIFKDDMVDILELYKGAEMIIWSFPLYYFGMPSNAKAVLDRFLPLNIPFINLSEDKMHSSHPHRYNLPNKKTILISSCGFPTKKNNYEALQKQFEIIYPEHVEILCSEGGILNSQKLKTEVGRYLKQAKMAGKEVAKSGFLSKKTKLALDKSIIPKEQYIKSVNSSWDINQSQNILHKSERMTNE